MQPDAEEVAAPAPDLMSALKASLEAVRARDGEATARRQETQSRRPRKPPAKKAAGQRKPPRAPRRKRRGKARRRQAVGGAPERRASKTRPASARAPSRLKATAPNATSRATPDAGRQRDSQTLDRSARARRGRAALRDPRAPRDAPALGPAPGARRRARLVGGAEGAAGARRRKTASRWRPRTTRSSTSTSTARSRRASTAPGTMTIWDQRHLRVR